MKIMKDVTERSYFEIAASEEYICINPEEAALVFNCLENPNPNGHAKDLVRVHLHLCLHCKEIVADQLLLGRANKALNYLLQNDDDYKIKEGFDEQGKGKELEEDGLEVERTY